MIQNSSSCQAKNRQGNGVAHGARTQRRRFRCGTRNPELAGATAGPAAPASTLRRASGGGPAPRMATQHQQQALGGLAERRRRNTLDGEPLPCSLLPGTSGHPGGVQRREATSISTISKPLRWRERSLAHSPPLLTEVVQGGSLQICGTHQNAKFASSVKFQEEWFCKEWYVGRIF